MHGSDEMSDEGVDLPPGFGRDERMPSTGDQVKPPPAVCCPRGVTVEERVNPSPTKLLPCTGSSVFPPPNNPNAWMGGWADGLRTIARTATATHGLCC